MARLYKKTYFKEEVKMKGKTTKRLMALMLAGTMTLGMGVTAFAADGDPAGSGNTTGTGSFEGHVDKSVLLVDLPTVPANDTTFAYTVDPEGLIAATQAAKYPDTIYDSTTGVYFQTSAGNYTDKSGKMKVTNKGSVDADVTVAVSMPDDLGGITAMKAKDGFTPAGGQELYLGLLVNEEAAVAVGGTGDSGKATKTVGLKGRPANFEVQYDSENQKYEYAAKSGVADTAWNSFEFGLEGACNQKGDYSAENFAVPTVTVTWSYIAHPETGGATMLTENATNEAGPSIAVTAYDYDRTATFDIVANFGAGDKAATTVKSVKIGADGKVFGTDLTSACTISGSTITFPSGKLGTAAVGDKKYVQVTFDKGDPVVLTLTIAK